MLRVMRWLCLYSTSIMLGLRWWAPSKFDPVKSPMLFFKKGQPVTPPLRPDQGLDMVLEHMVEELFSVKNNGTNVEVRLVNEHLYKTLKGSGFIILDITHLSEFKADAHPAAAGATMSNPYAEYRLFRNPKYDHNGKLLTLSDFLNLAKSQASVSGVMIIIEDAAYLEKIQNLSVTDAVIDTLSEVGYDNAGAQKVMIQSTKSSVLQKFKEKTNYELVYKFDEIVDDVDYSAVMDIKSFADSVVVKKSSIYRLSGAFMTRRTKTVSKLKSANLYVYAETFSNEFRSQAYDFFADGTVELNTFVQDGEIDGIITDFPKTANRYRRKCCS